MYINSCFFLFFFLIFRQCYKHYIPKNKPKNTKLSEQFQNPKEKSQKETKLIPLTLLHDLSLSYLGTETSIKSDKVDSFTSSLFIEVYVPR
jgi:hypothetical protein